MPQATVPSPRTWSPGDLVLVPRLRADVSDAVAFLGQRPFFIGQNSAGSSWPNNAVTSMPLNVELDDFWNTHSTTTGSAQIWCQAPGWYLCRHSCSWNYTSATQGGFSSGFQANVNGVTGGTAIGAQMLSGSTHPPVTQCWDLIQQVLTGPIGGGGDWIQAEAYQGTGGAVNLSGSASQLPTVSARWVCALTGTEPLPVPPLATAPSPITSAWLNGNVRDTINFLLYPPACRAQYSPGSASLASTTFPAGSKVPLNSTSLDTYGAFNTSTSTYTAPVAGVYFCAAQFNLAAAASATQYACGFTVNGGTTAWGDNLNKTSDSLGGGASAMKRIRLSAGDQVVVTGCQSSGGSIAYSTSSINQTRAIFLWDGA